MIEVFLLGVGTIATTKIVYFLFLPSDRHQQSQEYILYLSTLWLDLQSIPAYLQIACQFLHEKIACAKLVTMLMLDAMLQ